MTLYLPTLREFPHRIPQMFHAYLSISTSELPAQIYDIDPKAMELLKEYSWPHNFAQFQRVIRDLVMSASNQHISADSVRNALRREQSVGTLSNHCGIAGSPIDICRPLAEINRDIAHRVLKEMHGNNTAAAKQLGISRTTLWRLLQE